MRGITKHNTNFFPSEPPPTSTLFPGSFGGIPGKTNRLRVGRPIEEKKNLLNFWIVEQRVVRWCWTLRPSCEVTCALAVYGRRGRWVSLPLPLRDRESKAQTRGGLTFAIWRFIRADDMTRRWCVTGLFSRRLSHGYNKVHRCVWFCRFFTFDRSIY